MTEQVDEPVLAGAGDARVGQVLEVGDQAEFWMRVHPHSSKHTVQKYKAKLSHPEELFLDASALTDGAGSVA